MKLKITFLLFFITTTFFAQTLTISPTGETGSSGANWSITGTTLTAIGDANIAPSVITSVLNDGTDLTVEADKTISINANTIISTSVGGDGEATLTLRANEIVSATDQDPNIYTIEATSGKLNVVLISNQSAINDGTGKNVDLGYIRTNGGGLWVGGGTGGSWVPYNEANAITVGGWNASGASTAIKILGDVDTNGGNIEFVAETGNGGQTDVAATQYDRTITSGTGNITFRQSEVDFDYHSHSITLNTTGTLTIAPANGQYFHNDFSNIPLALTWNGTLSDGNHTGSDSIAGLVINDFANLGGLSIGSSTSTTNSDVTLSSAINIAGAINLYGGDIILNSDITTTATSDTGVSITGKKITQSAGVDVTTNGANIDYTVTNAAWTSGYDRGIIINPTNGTQATIDAQGGNISLTSSFASSGTTNSLSSNNDVAIVLMGTDISTSAGGTITLNGDMYNNASSTGAYIWGVDLRAGTILRTDSGDISIVGRAGKDFENARGIVSNQTDLKVLSNSGTITFTDLAPIGNTSYTGMYFRPSSVNSIKIGADGTLVSSSSSNIIFNTDEITFDIATSQISTTGTVTIQPNGDNFTAPINTTYLGLGSTITGLTIGKTTNTADVTIGSNVDINGAINIYGGNININSNLDTQGGGVDGDILLKASGNIITSDTKDITTNGGNIIFWADSDASNAGYIQIGDQSDLISNGGDITLSGGSTLTTGFANGGGTTYGVSIGGNNTNINNISSSGGDILIRGYALTDSDGTTFLYGVSLATGVNIDSGVGSTSIYGRSTDSYGINMAIGTYEDITIKSAKTSGTAITLDGWSEVSHGVVFNFDVNKQILATGGGDISITGEATTNGYGIFIQGVDILASSGKITLDGGTRGITKGGTLSSNIGSVTGDSNIASSSSDIDIIGDVLNMASSISIKTSGELSLLSSGNSFSSAISTSNFDIQNTLTGLTIGKTTNTSDIAISSALDINGAINIYGGSIDVNANITATDGHIVLDADTGAGLLTNLDGINIADGVTVQTVNSGDITFIGRSSNGNVSNVMGYRDNANTNITSAGALSINGISNSTSTTGTRGFVLSGTYLVDDNITLVGQDDTRDDVTFSGATITSVNGGIDIDGGTINGGFYTYGTNLLTAKNDITINVDRMYLAGNTINFNTDGQVSFLPKVGSATLGVALTLDTGITFDSGVTGLNVGSSTNTADVNIAGSIDIDGPINIYGGNINLNADLDTQGGTTSGDILLKATNNIIQAAGVDINTDGGNVIYWADSEDNGVGAIQLKNSGTNGGSITTAGGDITLGGGSNPLTDYAMANNGTSIIDAQPYGGVWLRYASLNAGGGDININGSNGSLVASTRGLYSTESTIQTSGTGTITLNGHGGTSTGATNPWGINIGGSNTIQTDSGNIYIYGISNTTNAGNERGMAIGGYIQSSSGNIYIEDRTTSSTQSNYATNFNGIYMPVTLGKGTLASSSSNIYIKANEIQTEASTTIFTTGEIEILPYTGETTFTNILTWNGPTTASSILIGSATNVANIVISGDQTSSGDMTIYSQGNVTQHVGDTLTVDGILNLLGIGGNFTLTDTGNDSVKLVGNTGSISYVDANALETNVITGTGIINIATITNDLIINGNITTTDTSNTAITLNAGKSEDIGTATGGDIIVSGTPTISTGTNGIAKLFSGSHQSSTGLTTLVGALNTRFGVDETTTVFDPVLVADNVYALYRSTSTLGTDTFDNNTFKLYPNPTSDYIIITKPSNVEIASVSLFDLAGRELKTSAYGTTNGELLFDINQFPSATYMLHIEAADGKKAYKLIIKK